ncbi:MAG: hemerythrin family protein [Deltaproteobacteria bacterium]|nr:hemerythrin family protein [Deltaproteobacteria bacterium]
MGAPRYDDAERLESLRMAIVWSKSLSTGVEWQDRQHKELFKRINTLLEAMNLGSGKAEVQKLFQFLDEYFVVHFDAEEQAMHKFDYPASLAHVAEHTHFIEDISRLREEGQAAMTTGLLIQTQRRVVDWLIHHIGSVDKDLGAFIKEISSRDKDAV